MRPRSSSIPALLGLALATASPACGTLASPSMGDVDLPTSLLGPFRAITGQEGAAGSTVMVQASTGSVDEPSVVTLNGLRVAYFTYSPSATAREIGRAAERRAAPPRGLSEFEFASSLMRAELPWEQGAIGSPSVLVESPSRVIMVYAGGGGFGLATSSDGATFTRRPDPILTADASQGESSPIEAPSIARAPTGEYFLAYASAGRIFMARAPEPEGPWTRIDGDPARPGRDAVLEPATMVAPDAGGAFEMRALSDPALSIHPTTTGRTFFRLFYTGQGPEPRTAVGAAASYDGGCTMANAGAPCFRRTGAPVYSERSNSVRAGSFELLDDRAAILWLSTGTATRRVISAAVAPATVRLEPQSMQ